MSTATDLFDTAEERLDKEETWVNLENEGDKVLIMVETFTMQQGKFGIYPVVRGVTRDGEPVALSGGRSVLKARLTENPPARGDVLGVKYLGEITSEKTGNSYHGYKVDLTAGGAPRPAAIETPEAEAAAADTQSDW